MKTYCKTGQLDGNQSVMFTTSHELCSFSLIQILSIRFYAMSYLSQNKIQLTVDTAVIGCLVDTAVPPSGR